MGRPLSTKTAGRARIVGEGMPEPTCCVGVVEASKDRGDTACMEETQNFYPRSSVHPRAPDSQGASRTHVLQRYKAAWKRYAMHTQR